MKHGNQGRSECSLVGSHQVSQAPEGMDQSRCPARGGERGKSQIRKRLRVGPSAEDFFCHDHKTFSIFHSGSRRCANSSSRPKPSWEDQAPAAAASVLSLPSPLSLPLTTGTRMIARDQCLSRPESLFCHECVKCECMRSTNRKGFGNTRNMFGGVLGLRRTI